MEIPVVFSTRRYAYLAELMLAQGGLEAGVREVSQFRDGERYQRILSSVQERDVVLVGGTISDSDTLELYDLACALAVYGSRTLSVIIPYFGYSTMERAVRPGEVVTAKSRARLFSSVPPAFRGNRFFLVDLHSEGIPHYFEAVARARHLYAKPVILEIFQKWGGENYVVACTDAGRAKWVESLANDAGVAASFVLKRRLGDGQTQISAINAHVEGARVLLYDDMIRTGGTLLAAGQAYREAGAKEIVAVATHGLFPGDSLEELRRSGLFEQVVTTNSHPRSVELAGDFLKVENLAPLLVQTLEQELCTRRMASR